MSPAMRRLRDFLGERSSTVVLTLDDLRVVVAEHAVLKRSAAELRKRVRLARYYLRDEVSDFHGAERALDLRVKLRRPLPKRKAGR